MVKCSRNRTYLARISSMTAPFRAVDRLVDHSPCRHGALTMACSVALAIQVRRNVRPHAKLASTRVAGGLLMLIDYIQLTSHGSQADSDEHRRRYYFGVATAGPERVAPHIARNRFHRIRYSSSESMVGTRSGQENGPDAGSSTRRRNAFTPRAPLICCRPISHRFHSNWPSRKPARRTARPVYPGQLSVRLHALETETPHATTIGAVPARCLRSSALRPRMARSPRRAGAVRHPLPLAVPPFLRHRWMYKDIFARGIKMLPVVDPTGASTIR